MSEPMRLELAAPTPNDAAPARTGAVPLRALWVLIPLALAPVLLAVLQLGRWHPDEVYQFLEPAFFRVNGYGIRAWEWTVGLRNWAVPLVFSWFIRVAYALGIDHPQAVRALIALPQLVLHGAMLVAVYRYAARRVEGPRAALFATVLVGVYAPVVLFAGRTMGESLSAAFLVLAFERLDRGQSARDDGLGAGLWLGLAVVVRYGSAVFVAATLVWLLATRRWRLALFTCVAGAAVALGLGALDWQTWGKPFHSLWAYLDFNVLSGRSAKQFGASPPGYYLLPLALWVAPWVWAGGVGAVLRERRLPAPLFAALVYVLSVTATAHKEVRFLYPAWIVLALVAAPEVVRWVSKLRAVPARVGLAVLVLGTGTVGFFAAPDFRGDQFRALVEATRAPDVTGLLIINEGRWGSGGHFYIGKNLPWYNADHPDHVLRIVHTDHRINRVITFEDRALKELQGQGFVEVGRIGRERILVRGPGREAPR